MSKLVDFIKNSIVTSTVTATRNPDGSIAGLMAGGEAFGYGLIATDQPSQARNLTNSLASRSKAKPFIQKVTAALYRIGYQLTDGTWAVFELGQPSSLAGGYAVNQITDIYTAAAVDPSWLDDTDASLAYTGSGWNPTSFAGTYGGSYRRNSTVGEYFVFTTPAACTNIAIRSLYTTNCGYGKVTINGISDLANSLPTAQEEVAAGRLPATALVANGGTLNPSDRLYNSYKSTLVSDEIRLIAHDLVNGIYSIKVEVTGYKQTGSTDARVSIAGIGYSSDDVVPTTSNLIPIKNIKPISTSTAYEYAWSLKIGSGTPYLVGCIHGYEQQQSLIVKSDGATVYMADGESLFGYDLSLDKETKVIHPDAADAAEITTAYSPGFDGLKVKVKCWWKSTGAIDSGYAGMLPLPNGSATARFYRQDAVVDAGGSADNGVNYFAGNAWAGVTENISVVFDDLDAFSNYQYSGNPLGAAWFEDRSGGALNKLYFARNQSGLPAETTPTTTVSRFRYLVF